MTMTNLKLSTSEQDMPILGGEMKAEYPYELRISLNQEVLNRLGIDEMPKVGAQVSFSAKAEVVGVNQDESGKNTVSLQITDINMAGGTSEDDQAQALFG